MGCCGSKPAGSAAGEDGDYAPIGGAHSISVDAPASAVHNDEYGEMGGGTGTPYYGNAAVAAAASRHASNKVVQQREPAEEITTEALRKQKLSRRNSEKMKKAIETHQRSMLTPTDLNGAVGPHEDHVTVRIEQPMARKAKAEVEAKKAAQTKAKETSQAMIVKRRYGLSQAAPPGHRAQPARDPALPAAARYAHREF